MKQKSSAANGQILDEACEWFAEFRADDVDARERERFDEWLRRSPEHIRAYIEIARIYVEVPPPPHPTGEIDIPALVAYAKTDPDNVVPLPLGGRMRDVVRLAVERGGNGQHTPRVARETFWIRRRAIAASIITAVVIASGVFAWQRERYPSYTTEIGERRSIQLSDGSTVDLNARSKLRIEFSGAERRVELIEGQALFQVAKDKARPFIVQSGDATVRAVGTQFDVDRKASGTTVTVLEGRVVVYSDAPTGEAVASTTATNSGDPTHVAISQTKKSGANGAPPDLSAVIAPPRVSGSAVFVAAGEQVTVTSHSLGRPERTDVAATTAWKQRQLIFDGAKLSNVVEAFNRNNRRQLIIESGALGDYHVSGVYSSTDPSALVMFLREQPGFKITETESEVRIASK